MRIAFCGEPVEKKLNLAEVLEDVIKLNLLVPLNADALELAERVGQSPDEEDLDWWHLWQAGYRRIDLYRRTTYKDHAISSFISETCALDEAAIMIDRASDKAAKASQGLQIVSDGNAHSMNAAEAMEASGIAQVLVWQAERELLDLWDIVLFVRPDKPNSVDAHMHQLVSSMPVAQNKVIELPTDYDEAVEYLKNESEKWLSPKV